MTSPRTLSQVARSNIRSNGDLALGQQVIAAVAGHGIVLEGLVHHSHRDLESGEAFAFDPLRFANRSPTLKEQGYRYAHDDAYERRNRL